MPYVIALNDVIEVKAFNVLGGQQAITTWYYQATGVTAPGVTDNDCLATLNAAAGPAFQAYMSANSRYNGMRLSVTLPVRQPFVSSIAGAGVGLNAVDALPPQTSGLISHRTAVAGPRGRGRTYLPFPTESMNGADGNPTAGGVALLQTWASVMMTTFPVTVGASTVTLTPVIKSRSLPTVIVITSSFAKTRWATQDRRSQIRRPDQVGP